MNRFIFKLLIVVAFVGLLSACSEGSGGNPPGGGDKIEPPVTEEKTFIVENYEKHKDRWNKINGPHESCSVYGQGDSDPFYCVKRACDNAGGTYDDKNKFCDCSTSGDGLFAFTPEAGGHCLPPKYEDYTNGARFLVIDKRDKLSIKSAGEFINGLEIKPEGFFFPYTSKTLMFSYFVNETSDDETILLNLNRDLEIIGNVGVGAQGNEYVEFVYDEVQLYSFSLQQKSPEDIFAKLEAANSDLEKVIKAYKKFKQIGESFNYDRIRGRTDDMCSHHCYGEKYIELEDGYAVVRDLYVGGVHSTRQLFLNDRKSVVGASAVVSLDRLGQANLIYLIKHKNPKPGLFASYVDVYKRDGVLFKSQLPIKEISPEMEEQYNKIEYPNNVKAHSGLVAVCEHGTDYLWSRDYERVVFGPYVSQEGNFSGSIWGWEENLDNNVDAYNRGAYPFGNVGFTPPDYYDLATLHHKGVMNTVLMSSEVAQVTSVEERSCYGLDPKENPLLRDDFKGRVTNTSLHHNDTGVACGELMKPLHQTEDKILWVIAAGNDTISTCSKKMQVAKNAAGVAAISPEKPERLEKYSIRGKDLVLTAAIRTDFGTSFAAPVVAAYAGEVSYLYPEMSILNLRRSIYLGVEFLRLNVMSGGRTDKEKVLIVADILNEEPHLSDRRVLKKAYKSPIFKNSKKYQHIKWVEKYAF